MTLKPDSSIPANYITDAAKANGDRYLYVTSDGNPVNSHIRLSDGTNLGLVQSVKWELSVNGYSKCVVETIASPAELATLMRDTTVVVRLQDKPLRVLWAYYSTRAREWFRSLRS
jgi:hypothetical protein